MSKRNTFLDAESDEEDLASSENEGVRDSRFSNLGTKRRKISLSQDEDPSEDEFGSEAEENSREELGDLVDQKENGNAAAHGVSDEDETQSQQGRKSLKVLSAKQLEKAQQRARKTGVIYISRVPPFMKPGTVRQLLSPYGTLLRSFMTPEPPSRYQARIKAGGNKKHSWVEGWVEFESKKKAKICAELLNGNIIGGKKSGFYHDDLWNIKYLKGFKWNDLMEQVQNEEREREGRLRAEIHRETRERKTFLDNVEQAKVERGKEAKRRKKEHTSTSAGLHYDEEVESKLDFSNPPRHDRKPRLNFRQNAVRAHGDDSQSLTNAKKGKGALSKVF